MDLFFKAVIFLLLGFIIFTLGRGMFFLTRDEGQREKNRVVKALTTRIVLSLFLFLLLIAGYFAGILQPHGI